MRPPVQSKQNSLIADARFVLAFVASTGSFRRSSSRYRASPITCSFGKSRRAPGSLSKERGEPGCSMVPENRKAGSRRLGNRAVLNDIAVLRYTRRPVPEIAGNRAKNGGRFPTSGTGLNMVFPGARQPVRGRFMPAAQHCFGDEDTGIREPFDGLRDRGRARLDRLAHFAAGQRLLR